MVVEVFKLVIPSVVLRNAVFYCNKCGNKIIQAFDYDIEKARDFLFEKIIR